MLKNYKKPMEELFSKFAGQDTENQAILFEEINKELEAFLAKENNDKDATDNVLNLLSTIPDSIQKEFGKLISSDRHRKRFDRALDAYKGYIFY